MKSITFTINATDSHAIARACGLIIAPHVANRNSLDKSVRGTITSREASRIAHKLRMLDCTNIIIARAN